MDGVFVMEAEPSFFLGGCPVCVQWMPPAFSAGLLRLLAIRGSSLLELYLLPKEQTSFASASQNSSSGCLKEIFETKFRISGNGVYRLPLDMSLIRAFNLRISALTAQEPVHALLSLPRPNAHPQSGAQ